MKVETLLQKFGLTHKEATLYIAALELGSGSVQHIAEKAGLVRSTAYTILERLREKGLVTTYLRKRVRWYSAEDPEQVVRWTENNLSVLKLALPELNRLTGAARRRPSVRFYEGKDGVTRVLQEMLGEAEELRCFSSADDLFRVIENFPNFVEERRKKKIPIRVILRDSPLARERQRLGPEQLREVRLASPEPSFHGVTYLWKNTTALFSLEKDIVAVVIDSPAIAEMQQAFFEHLWQRLK